MKKIYYITFIAILSSFIISCGTRKVTSYKKTGSKKVYSSSKNNNTKNSGIYRSSNKGSVASKDVNKVLKTAKSFIGTPYKYGGTTRSGFDCSGLVYISFKELDLDLPRVSRDQAQYGKEIDIKQVKLGDLIFFNTSGSSISHVGIVENIDNGGVVNFIHSSTSKGVMISSLDENYWKARFVKAVRLL